MPVGTRYVLITQLLILNKGSNNHFVLQEQAAALLNLNETHTQELSFKASLCQKRGLGVVVCWEKGPPPHHQLCHRGSGFEASSASRAGSWFLQPQK